MPNQTLFQAVYPSPLGPIQVLASERGLSSLDFHEKNPDFQDLKDLDPGLEKALAQYFSTYFKGLCPDLPPLPLDLQGTPFQKAVWDLTKNIPYGALVTYGDLAKILGEKLETPSMSARALGTALGKNPLPLLIPCHRVIGKDRNLRGYAYGLPMKKYLLTLEGHEIFENRVLPRKNSCLKTFL